MLLALSQGLTRRDICLGLLSRGNSQPFWTLSDKPSASSWRPLAPDVTVNGLLYCALNFCNGPGIASRKGWPNHHVVSSILEGANRASQVVLALTAWASTKEISLPQAFYINLFRTSTAVSLQLDPDMWQMRLSSLVSLFGVELGLRLYDVLSVSFKYFSASWTSFRSAHLISDFALPQTLTIHNLE